MTLLNHVPQDQTSMYWHAKVSPISVPLPTPGPCLAAKLFDSQYLNSDDTLRRIYEVANEDVEMKDAPSGDLLYIVVDTNVLIDHINVVTRFIEDIEALTLPVVIVVPNVVISELDGLKQREELKWFARTATTWILDRMKERKFVKVQAREETCNTRPNDISRKNDLSIYDCALFFRRKGYVVVLSGDKNLCIECEKDGITTLTPSRRSWSSRDIARSLFVQSVDLGKFRGHEPTPSYRPAHSSAQRRMTVAPAADNDDGMDIDDDNSNVASNGSLFEDYIPSHALDSLHLQVINHFTIVLKGLAFRICSSAGDLDPPSRSSHAPGYRRKNFGLWTVGDCLDYLASKKPLRPSTPPLHVFLLRRSEDRGWRRGQDWSRQDWENCLVALNHIGMKFEDGTVLGSVNDLTPEVERVFMTPMRPTGI
ncbi:hypothetical protein AcV5_000689 [Taiwanofungus camphoratus]|nr:hypothetical protein AcV5_000689 [Antrodia cinnamomea]